MKVLINLYKKYISSLDFSKCAAMSYYTILALIPGLYTLFLIIDVFHISMNSVETFLLQIMPLESVKSLISYTINISHASIYFTIVVLVSSVFILSQGVFVFLKHIKQEFNIKHNNFILLRIKAFFITIFLIFILAISIVILMFLLPLFTQNISEIYYYLILYAFIFIIHFIITSILYKLCVTNKVGFKTIYKGILFFTVIASMLYLGFSPFIRVFTNNYARYGPLAPIASTLIFFYLYFVLLLLSININLNEYKKMIK